MLHGRRLGCLGAVVGGVLAACGRPRTPPAHRETARPSAAPNTVVAAPSASSHAGVTDPQAEALAWFRAGCEVESEQAGALVGAGAAALAKKLPAARTAFVKSSPTGTLAFVAADGGIAMSSPDGTRHRRLVRPPVSGGQHTDLAWSPSGDALAFVSNHGEPRGRVVLLAADCSAVQFVSGPLDHGPMSSPRGGTFHVSFSRGGRLLQYTQDGELVERDLASGTTRKAACRSRRLSPDERWCVDGAGSELSLTSSEPVADPPPPALPPLPLQPRALRLKGLELVMTPIWTHDGKSILFGGSVDSWRMTRATGLYRVDVPAKTTNGPIVSTPTRIVPGLLHSDTTPFLSPDGTRVLLWEEYAGVDDPPEYADVETSVSDVSWVELASKKRIVLGWKHELPARDFQIWQPTWSPDSRFAAVTVSACTAKHGCWERTSAIAIADADRLGLVALGEQPAWTAREWVSP